MGSQGQGRWRMAPGAGPQETQWGFTAASRHLQSACLCLNEILAPLLPKGEDEVLLRPHLSDLV